MADTTRADVLGILVEQHLPAIVKQASNKSFLMDHARIELMDAGTVTIPVMVTAPEFSAVQGENLTDPLSKKTTSEVGFTTVDLVAADIATIVPLPEAVEEDIEGRFEDYILPVLAADLAKKIDQWGLFDAPGRPVRWGPSVMEVIEAADATVEETTDFAADANDALTLVEESGFNPTAIAAGRGVRGILRGLRDDNGAPIYESISAGSDQGTLYGVPIDYTAGWDKTQARIIAGDWSNAIIGIRTEVRVKRLDQATVNGVNLAETDAVAYRVNVRIAFTTVSPLTNADEGVTASPFAAVVPAAVEGGGA